MSGSEEIGQLKVLLSAQTAEYIQEMEKARGASKEVGEDVKTSAGGINQAWGLLKVGGTVAVAALGAVAGAASFMLAEAAEAQQGQMQLNAVLASTGGVAGVTADDVNRLAAEYRTLTGVDDDVIIGAESLMLTFTQIGKEIFPDAIMAAMDMSTALKSDLNGAVTMVSKALNVQAGDVTMASTAMNAMRRVGVAFTSEQVELAKQLVATGDVLGYQRLILNELNTEFAGSAVAAGQTLPGALDKLKYGLLAAGGAWGDALLPATQQFVEGVTPSLNESLDVMTQAHLPAFVELVNQASEGMLDAVNAGLLLITWNERLNLAYAEQSSNLLATSDSYEEYATQVLQAAVAAEQVHSQWVNMHGAALIAGEGFAKVGEAIGLLTKEQYEAVKAGQALEASDQRLMAAYLNLNPVLADVASSTAQTAQAQRDLQQSMNDLKLFMDGPLGDEYVDFQTRNEELSAKVVVLKNKIAELESKTYLTPAQKQELESLRGELGKTETAITDLATTHEDATRRIMFDLLTQRAAMDGFTTAEVAFLSDIAVQWGLTDQATADYVMHADAYLGSLETVTGEHMSQVRYEHAQYLGILDETDEHPAWVDVPQYMKKWLTTADENMGPTATDIGLLHGPLTTARDLAGDVADNLNNIPAEVNVKIKVTTEYVGGAGGWNPDDPVYKQTVEDPMIVLAGALGIAGQSSGPGGTFSRLIGGELEGLRAQLDEIDAMLDRSDMDPFAYMQMVQKRADLVKEIEEREQAITEYQQKQDELGKLKAQMDLIEMAKSAGVGMDVFAGRLGKDASVTDLMGIMDTIMAAMLDQANASLDQLAPEKNGGTTRGRFGRDGGTSFEPNDMPRIVIENMYINADNAMEFLDTLHAMQ